MMAQLFENKVALTHKIVVDQLPNQQKTVAFKTFQHGMMCHSVPQIHLYLLSAQLGTKCNFCTHISEKKPENGLSNCLDFAYLRNVNIDENYRELVQRPWFCPAEVNILCGFFFVLRHV